MVCMNIFKDLKLNSNDHVTNLNFKIGILINLFVKMLKLYQKRFDLERKSCKKGILVIGNFIRKYIRKVN